MFATTKGQHMVQTPSSLIRPLDYSDAGVALLGSWADLDGREFEASSVEYCKRMIIAKLDRKQLGGELVFSELYSPLEWYVDAVAAYEQPMRRHYNNAVQAWHEVAELLQTPPAR